MKVSIGVLPKHQRPRCGRASLYSAIGIKIALQLGIGAVKLLAKGDAVKLAQQRLVETLANAVRLRAPCLRARMIDVLNGNIELVLVRLAAELSSAVGRSLRPQ